MISRISGRVKEKKSNCITVDINGVCYEIMIPPAVMKALDKEIDNDGFVELVTYHYFQMDTSRGIPVLVGFLNEVEKEFFECFITVSGVGPKAACKALSLPFSSIADAIDRGDISLLKKLPGIGEQKAREIVAKLQGKVGKFGLIQDRNLEFTPKVKEDIKEEALSVLLQLQYKKREAQEMIQKALMSNPEVESCEDILNEVYKQKSGAK